MLTTEQLEKRRFDLNNIIATQRMEGIEIKKSFLNEMSLIMENDSDEEALLALANLKRRVMNGEVF